MVDMKGWQLLYAFLTLIALGVSFTIAGDGIKPQYKATEKAFFLTAAEETFLRPGLNLTIQNVAINGTSVTVSFQITDNAGQGLDRLGIQTPGAVAMQFILARIKPGDTQYTNYFTSARTNT